MCRLHCSGALGSAAGSHELLSLCICMTVLQVAGAACGLKVQGQLLRQGPDGKGSTAKHMPSFTGKKVRTSCASQSVHLHAPVLLRWWHELTPPCKACGHAVLGASVKVTGLPYWAAAAARTVQDKT